jgi:hypothetical protein
MRPSWELLNQNREQHVRVTGHVMNVIGVVRNAEMDNLLEPPGPFFLMPLADCSCVRFTGGDHPPVLQVIDLVVERIS